MGFGARGAGDVNFPYFERRFSFRPLDTRMVTKGSCRGSADAPSRCQERRAAGLAVSLPGWFAPLALFLFWILFLFFTFSCAFSHFLFLPLTLCGCGPTARAPSDTGRSRRLEKPSWPIAMIRSVSPAPQPSEPPWSRFRVWSSGLRVEGVCVRVPGSGFRGQFSRFWIQGSGFRV